MKRLRVIFGIAVPVAFFAAVGAYVWTADTGRRASAADREIIRANVLTEVPETATPLGARLGGKIELAAVEQESGEAMAGEETKVTFYWRCLRPVSADRKVFAHLEGPLGTRQSLDHHPVYGLYPIPEWEQGEIVRDEVWVTFPPDAARGEHVLWVGVFLQEDPYPRLALDNADDVRHDAEGRVHAATWRVR